MPAGGPLSPPPNVVGGNPLASGAFESPSAATEGSSMASGDPLAAGASVGAGDTPESQSPPPPAAPAGPEFGAESAGPAGPGSAAESAPPPPAGTGSGAESAPPAGAAPAPADSPAPPAAAHPSDETPAGYVTAESLWPAGAPRPSEADPDAPQSSPPDQAAEAASVAQRSAQGQAGTPATRHSFPAVPRDAVSAAAPASPPRQAGAPNRARIDGRTAAIVAVVVLLAAAVTTAVVVLTGGSEPERASNAVVEDAKSEPVATTAAPRTDELDAQVKQLGELMLLSKKGRAQAVEGDVKAAAASRAQLLKDIRALDADTGDKALKAGLVSFGAAIRESLRQNRECGSKCSIADLQKVGRLKQAALKRLNPILKAHGARTYKPVEI